MSDKILNKLQAQNRQNGIVFSKKELAKENREVLAELDKRINDLLHKIEFTNATPREAYKLYMKLQGFLRKKRAVKPAHGKVYVPRTETGNYIINGQVTKMKKRLKTS